MKVNIIGSSICAVLLSSNLYAAGLDRNPGYPERLRLAGSEPLSTAEPAASVEKSGPLRNCLFCPDYPILFVRDVKRVFTAPLRWDSRDWLTSGAAAAVIVGTGVFLDRKIEKKMQENRSDATDRVAAIFEPFGAIYSAGILGGFYLAGAALKNDKAVAVGLDGLSATMIASGLIATSVKEAAGRSRPSDGDGTTVFRPFSGHTSFPSGHTTQAFVTASVISAHYPTPWVEVPAYGIAALVGFARIDHDAHFASDVLAGAVLGTSVGYVVVYFNNGQRAAAPGARARVALAPLSDPEVPGVEVILNF